MASILTSLIVVNRALTLIGCCIIPCIRGLTIWFIEVALGKQIPVSCQLFLSTAEIKSQLMLSEFKEYEIKRGKLWKK
jgi:hypothetical protein